MKKTGFRFKIIGIIAALLVSTSAMALELDTYAELGEWTLIVPSSDEVYGCSLVTYADDSILTMTITVHDSGFGLIVANPEWTWIEEGKPYPINQEIDQMGVWHHTMVGVNDGLFVRTPMSVDVQAMIVELIAGNVVRFAHGDEVLAEFSLKDSRKATEVWVECLSEEVDEYRAHHRPPASTMKVGRENVDE